MILLTHHVYMLQNVYKQGNVQQIHHLALMLVLFDSTYTSVSFLHLDYFGFKDKFDIMHKTRFAVSINLCVAQFVAKALRMANIKAIPY